MKAIITFGLLILFGTAVAQSFEEAATILGIDHHYGTGSAGGGVSFYDFNRDGWDDITFASQLGDSISFFENREGNFKRINSFVPNLCESKQILWVDYDNDGDKDLFVGCYLSTNRLYKNDGKMVFTDVTEMSGLPLSIEKTFGVAWADYDNDGWLDLYVTNKPEGATNVSNQLFRSKGDGTFEELTSLAGVADPNKKPFSASFLDYNNDGAADIYIAQDKKAVNTLFKNDNDGSFTDVSVASNSDLSMEGMCVAVGDYNNDGYQDIYISNISEGNRLLKNNGNETFIEVSEATGVAYHGIGWGSNFLDYDNDGDLDLYVSGSLEGSSEVPSMMYTNDGVGSFQNMDVGFVADTVISFSNAIGDIDNDGYPDIVVNNFNEYASMVWKNKGGVNNWLKIQLQGGQSNRDGIGTSISAYFNNKKITRYTHCGIGFLAQNSAYELLGLGESTEIDSLTFAWPSGHVDKLRNIKTNQKIKIIEGSTLLPPRVDILGNSTLCPGDSVILETGFYESYLWSTGETSRTIVVSKRDEVKVSVVDYTDNAGESETVSVSVHDSLKLSFETTPTGANANSGSIKVVVNGGAPPYSFEWNHQTSNNSELLGDLAPGTYSVNVKDNNGCNVSGTATVSLLVGLEDPSEFKALIYPNPANKQVIVNLKDFVGKGFEFKMMDLSGKVVSGAYYDAISTEKELTLNIDKIHSGLYLIEIKTEKLVYRTKLIIDH